MESTKRIFTDIEENEPFRLYVNSDTHEYFLISDGTEKYAKGTEVNGFYICAHDCVTIRINGKKDIKLSQGSFYNLKEGEAVTHKKYAGFSRFTKSN